MSKKDMLEIHLRHGDVKGFDLILTKGDKYIATHFDRLSKAEKDLIILMAEAAKKLNNATKT